MKNQTAIVTVAGISEITTAANLAKNGYEVKAPEKEAYLGLSTYSGPVLLSNRSASEPILTEKGTISVQNMANAVAAARA